jgi:phage/plasmid-like protein (TIGR03299 family)
MKEDTIIQKVDEAISHAGRRTMLGGAGVLVDNAMTASDAITRGGLDWDIELRQQAWKNARGTWTTDKNDRKIVRVNPNGVEVPFATVGSRYTALQNRDIFAFGDNLVDDFGARWEAAWQERGGRTVGLTMRLPEGVKVGGDDYDKYLLFRTRHDGKGSVIVAAAFTRLWCTNMVTGILANAEHKYRITHIQGADQKIAAAREALEMSFAVEDTFTSAMNDLLDEELVGGDAERIVRNAIDASVRNETTQVTHTRGILHALEASQTISDDQRTNRYGLLQATTEYLQWLSPGRSDESTLIQNFSGWRARATRLVATA